jgi:hypothetical protein
MTCWDKKYLSSLFILFGWRSISMASLMMRSMYRILVARMEVFEVECGVPSRRCVELRLTCLDVQGVFAADAPSIQNPLWVRQGLHWADRQFRGHQVEGCRNSWLYLITSTSTEKCETCAANNKLKIWGPLLQKLTEESWWKAQHLYRKNYEKHYRHPPWFCLVHYLHES